MIEVTDTGIGIDPQFLSRIWRPFERINHNGTRGSGLGLTITKLLVEILGGDIDVESELGRGSTFRVKLMLPSILRDTSHENGLATLACTLPVVGYHGPRQSLMVVDDDLHHLALVSHVFEPLGFAVMTASSAELALHMLADFKPDLFILDIDMPGQDGWSLAQQLRNGTWAGVPIIMISGHANDADTPKSQMALYDAFIAKPYNLDDLVMRTANLLKLELKQQVDIADAPVQTETLSSQHAAKLIKLALSGQATAIRKHLQDLEDAQACPEPLLATLKAQLATFDLKAMAHKLEADADG